MSTININQTETARPELRAVQDWITTFAARPNKDVGRPGPVCPFVPGALEAQTLWLVAEEIADLSVPEVVQLANGYKRAFLDTPPLDGPDADYKALVLAFPDLAADRAEGFFGELLEQLAVSSYEEDGLVVGAFYERNAGTAIYNPDFRPFRPPVPFLLMRLGVVGDWKFFLDDDAALSRWARRFGESAVHALAAELRRLPWRTTPAL